MTMREANKHLKNNLKYLRKQSKETKLSANYKTVLQLLRENLTLLEREGLFAHRQLKTVRGLPKEQNHTRILSLCEDAVLNLSGSVQTALLEQLYAQNQWLTTQELSLLPDLLKMELIDLAAMGVKSENADIVDAAIGGLHELKDLDMERIFQEFSYTEKVFSQDPAGAYTHMDQQTRAYYRAQCAKQARRFKVDETEYADRMLQTARDAVRDRDKHIGVPLLENARERKQRRSRGYLFIGARMVLPWAFSSLIAYLLDAPWLALLLYVPVHEILRPLLERVFMLRVAPYFMPRMELSQAIPPELRTLVTVSALLPRPENARAMAQHMEKLYLANNNGAIDFCLLVDFPESKTQTRPDDRAAADALRQAIEELNQRHGNRFCLVIRLRAYIKTQKAYAGWERKRGAILQLVRYSKGEQVAFDTVVDPAGHIRASKYLLALDQDSQLLFNSAYEMVTAAAHPLNRPVIDEKRGLVTRGYGILAPTIANRLDAVSKTLFSLLFTGDGGVSAYNSFCSNHNQDLFGASAFCGKGLLHVDAYYQCLNREVEAERVLSHDILEGAFLRCGYVSDVEVADGNPADAIAWNKRLHRWIRGDFQNVLWLLPFRRMNGSFKKNPLRVFDRLLMNDNLVREMQAPFAFALLLTAALYKPVSLACALIAVLSLLINGILSAVLGLIQNGLSALNMEYYSGYIPRALTDLLRGVMSVVTLVTDTVVSLGGAAKGLFRQFISHKNLLEWATAHDVDFAAKNGLMRYLYHNGVSAAAGVLTIWLAPAYMRLFGIAFFICPFLQWWLSQPLPKPKKIVFTKDDETYLLEQGRKMWQFYADTCTAADHFLPPDNLQVQPAASIAHRTSPTNIGLMLLSCICAEDLGYIDPREMVRHLARTYDTVEKLERWHDHLLNWYDTETLRPLWPRYCSTVDSGNFACCLVAVVNRLKEVATREAAELAERMERYLLRLDFTPLYNTQRNLFHIGYDLESKQLSGSYYDMLMSESRMTGYYAIARRQVPKKHWGALARTLTRFGRTAGPMSWTGTAFEYLMAPLLLPTVKGTLSYEAVKFCIACQRACAAGQPWGRSESGYYDFDDQLNYQYKPHGVNRLALKCFDKQERVIAPYATFLALPFAPKAAMENLKRIQRMGGTGRYGFFEAVDFTKSRCSHSHYELVSSFMAHHVGMSLCALENTLRGNRLHKWFMQGDMAGAEVLLLEKIPNGAPMYRHLIEKDVPDKPRYPLRQNASWETPNPLRPSCTLFTNKSLTCAADTAGRVKSRYGDLLLYTSPPDSLERATGFMAFFGEEHAMRSITLAPHYADAQDYQCELGKNRVRYVAKNGVLTGEMQLLVAKEHPAEIRKIVIKNHSNHTVRCNLILYFEPVLHTEEEMRSHPAFYKLFLESKWDASAQRLLVKKRNRHGGAPAFLAAGFAGTQANDYTVQCRADDAIRYRSGRFSFMPAADNQTASVPNPCCRITLRAEIGPKESLRRVFVLAAGQTAESANAAFEACLHDSPAESPFYRKTVEGKLAQKILPALLAPCRHYSGRARNVQYRAADLWRAGVSGNLPVWAMEIRNTSEIVRLKPYLDAYSLLSKHGVPGDFCVIYRELGDYSRQLYGNIITVINNCGLGPRLGKAGGVHLINAVGDRADLRKIFLCSADFTVPKDLSEFERMPASFTPAFLYTVKPRDPGYPHELDVSGGYFSGGRFVVTGRPKVPWTHILANTQFGTQVSHRSLGFTYAENARENRLTPWSNNTVTDHTGERLILKLNHQYYDLIDGSTAEFAPDFVRYHGMAANYPYQVTVTVEGYQKRIDVQFTAALPAGTEIAYCVLPTLYFDRRHAHRIYGDTLNGVPVVTQPFNTAYKGVMALNNSSPFRACFDYTAFLRGQWQASFAPPFDHSCLAGIAAIHQHTVFALAYGADSEQARQNATIQPEARQQKRIEGNAFYVSTPETALDVMMNTFLPHQVKASRLFSRTGFYQCSGAYGFRDQLQDAGNLAVTDPDLARRQILLCCGRQFTQGDVLHWWHELPEGPVGVRTRCSDDRLWLPLYVARYVTVTGDTALLQEEVPYLDASPLAPDEQERYSTHLAAAQAGTVWDHCKRAMEAAAYSKRGLALIGSCDWNDGFSNVGRQGLGESVWLTQFIAMVCEDFAPVCDQFGEKAYAASLRERAAACKRAVEEHCWDGDRYTRAYFDNGTAMGANASQENKIDMLTQAFAVLAGLPDQRRNRTAVLTAYDLLTDHDCQLIRLFTPPFHAIDAGYISAYPQGLRENGGQYTHGVLWLVQALLRLGEAEKAYRLIRYINPAHRCQNEAVAGRYLVEPYAVAGDVYTHADAAGRGGWTHYTGAAGWLYRIVMEDLFGIHVENGRIVVRPVLPKALYNAVCTVKIDTTEAEIRFRLTGPYRGKPVMIPLDGKRHIVTIGDPSEGSERPAASDPN